MCIDSVFLYAILQILRKRRLGKHFLGLDLVRGPFIGLTIQIQYLNKVYY